MDFNDNQKAPKKGKDCYSTLKRINETKANNNSIQKTDNFFLLKKTLGSPSLLTLKILAYFSLVFCNKIALGRYF